VSQLKRRIKTCVLSLAIIIQAGLVGGVAALQRLTRLKAGVMRHLYQRRLQYEQAFLTPQFLWGLSFLNLVGAVLCLYRAYCQHRKKGNRRAVIYWQIAGGLNLWNLFVVHGTYFKDLLAHPYFMLAFHLVWVIQVIGAMITEE